jgi:pimeloyl-ACP methyl ester carboxylesterase
MKPATIFKSPQGRDAILAVYDRILAQWPVPYQAHRLPTRHGETFVLTCGDDAAPPLVLLHGSAANSAMWVGDAKIFSPHYRVIAIDVPGEPGKSQVVRFGLDGPAAFEWLQDVLLALGVERVSLLGISLGGWLSLKFAATCPERVDKLVLLCPAWVAPTQNSFMLKAIPLSFLGKWGSVKVISILNAGKPLDRDTRRYIQLINANFKPRMQAAPLFTDGELKKLTMPVLLVAGAKDPLVDTPKTAARLRRLLPNVRVDILPEAGHVLANMADRVLPFLSAPAK